MKQVQGLCFPDQDEFMIGQVDAAGGYQRAHLEKALDFVTDFTRAVDGGAHVGLWTRLLAQRFTVVEAFEPSTDTFECLQANVASLENVTLRQCAIGNRNDWVDMTLDAANRERKNTGARHVTGGGRIQMIPLDSLKLEDVGFIKLDIEGSEPWALEGARKTIEGCRPIILFEAKDLWNKHFGLPREAVVRILRDHRYKPLAAVGSDRIWGPK